MKYRGDGDDDEMDWPSWTDGRIFLRDGNGNNSKPLAIHRLVAEHFVECILTAKPRYFCYVKHLDGNKTNNRADNLYWSTSPHGLFRQPKIHRRPKLPSAQTAKITVHENEQRQSIIVYTRVNGTKHEKEFRYIRIGKDKAREKANEYIKQFKEHNKIED